MLLPKRTTCVLELLDAAIIPRLKRKYEPLADSRSSIRGLPIGGKPIKQLNTSTCVRARPDVARSTMSFRRRCTAWNSEFLNHSIMHFALSWWVGKHSRTVSSDFTMSHIRKYLEVRLYNNFRVCNLILFDYLILYKFLECYLLWVRYLSFCSSK